MFLKPTRALQNFIGIEKYREECFHNFQEITFCDI